MMAIDPRTVGIPPIPSDAMKIIEDAAIAGRDRYIARFHALDQETWKIMPGIPAPRIVCLSHVSRTEAPAIAIGSDILTTARRILDSDAIVVGANLAFDFACLAEADASLLPLIFRAYEEARVHDVLICQALDAIAGGHLGLVPKTLQKLRNADGKQTGRYSLYNVTSLVLGRDDAKAQAAYRTSYRLLDIVPLDGQAADYPLGCIPVERWPDEAREYVLDDVKNPLEIAERQLLGWTRGGADEYDGPARNMQDLAAQCEAAFALHLGACWSLRTDRTRVEALAAVVEEKHRIAVARFQQKGWIRKPCEARCGRCDGCVKPGTEDQVAVKRAIAFAYGAEGTCLRCLGAGRVTKYVEEACRGEKARGRFQGCLGPACSVCAGAGRVVRAGGTVTCKVVEAEADEIARIGSAWVAPGELWGCDGTGFDLNSAKMLPRSDKNGVKTDRDSGMESGDDDLSDFSENETEKIRSTYLPYLRRGLDRPLSLNPNALVASGRCSYDTIHQFPRKGGVRETVRARGPWCGAPEPYAIISTDYAAGELCLSGDTRILTSQGYVAISELAGKRFKVFSKFSDEHTFQEKGSFCSAKAFSTGVKSVLRITTVDGRRIECTDNHPLLVQRMYGKRPTDTEGRQSAWRKIDYEWRPASEVKIGESLVSGAGAIDENKPKLDPKFYTFGHFVGDGWFHPDSNGRINTGVCASEKEIHILHNVLPVWEALCREAEEFIETRYDNRYKKSLDIRLTTDARCSRKSLMYCIAISKPHVVRLLQQRYGFTAARAPQKRFPACYWTATPDQKRSFLRGLFDADGSIVTAPRRSVSFTAANEEMARDVMIGLSEFGIEARLTTHYIKSRDRSQTILQVRGLDQFSKVAKHVLFQHRKFRSIKAERLLKALPKEVQKHRHGLVVKSIERLGRRPVFNVEVPLTRHYTAEGFVVHNCALAQVTLWWCEESKMLELINSTQDPGSLHTKIAAQMLSITFDEARARVKAGDKQAKDFRQASKCFHPDTEILTRRRGWVRIADLTMDDEVASVVPHEGRPAPVERVRGADGRFSPALDGHTREWHQKNANKITIPSMEIVWTKPERLTTRKATDGLLHLKNNGIDLRVTPDHGMLVYGSTKLLKHVEAREFGKQRGWFNAGMCMDGKVELDERLLRLAVATQADGNYIVNGEEQKNIRFGFSKKRKINRLASMLRSGEFSTGVSTNGDVPKLTTWFKLSAELSSKVKTLLDSDKTLPWWWLELTPRLREVVLDEVSYWDSYQSARHFDFSSSIKKNCEVLQALAVLTNRKARYAAVQERDNIDHNQNYKLSVRDKYDTRGENLEVCKLDYNGDVFCLTVLSGSVLVRDRGIPVITDQCANFGFPGGLGSATLVLTNRRKNAGSTTTADGFEYAGIRFCVLMGGADRCGLSKVTKWNRSECPPVCKACVKIVEEVLKPAFFKSYPEVKKYLEIVSDRTRDGLTIPALAWDKERGEVVVLRDRGGCGYTDGSNQGFQGLLSDAFKRAFSKMTREGYLGTKPDGSPSPLYGTRFAVGLHDEPLAEGPLRTLHVAGPRIAELMIESGQDVAPDVYWKAEPAAMYYWSKDAETVYEDGKLVPWEPKK